MIERFKEFLTTLTNWFVDVTITTDKRMKSSTYIFGFKCFFYSAYLHIFEPLKGLMKSEIVKSIGIIDSLILWMLFSLFFRTFL